MNNLPLWLAMGQEYNSSHPTHTSSIVHGVLVGAGSLANIEAPIWCQVDIDHGVKEFFRVGSHPSLYQRVDN